MLRRARLWMGSINTDGGVAQCSLLSGRKGEPFLPLWNVECGMWQWKWQCPFVSSELIKTPKSLPG